MHYVPLECLVILFSPHNHMTAECSGWPGSEKGGSFRLSRHVVDWAETGQAEVAGQWQVKV